MTTRTTLPARLAAAVGAVVIAACCAGCGGADQYPDRGDGLGLYSAGAGGAEALVAEVGGGGNASDDFGLGGGTAQDDTDCSDGEQRKCKVMLPETNGVANCFVGVNLCENGQWGPCVSPPSSDADDAAADPSVVGEELEH